MFSDGSFAREHYGLFPASLASGTSLESPPESSGGALSLLVLALELLEVLLAVPPPLLPPLPPLPPPVEFVLPVELAGAVLFVVELFVLLLLLLLGISEHEIRKAKQSKIARAMFLVEEVIHFLLFDCGKT